MPQPRVPDCALKSFSGCSLPASVAPTGEIRDYCGYHDRRFNQIRWRLKAKTGSTKGAAIALKSEILWGHTLADGAADAA